MRPWSVVRLQSPVLASLRSIIRRTQAFGFGARPPGITTRHDFDHTATLPSGLLAYKRKRLIGLESENQVKADLGLGPPFCGSQPDLGEHSCNLRALCPRVASVSDYQGVAMRR